MDRANANRDFNWTLDDTINPILKSFGIDPYDMKAVKKYIRENVAGYPLKYRGAQFYKEIFAEAFSEYMTLGERSRPFALALGKAVEPYLKVKVNYGR